MSILKWRLKNPFMLVKTYEEILLERQKFHELEMENIVTSQSEYVKRLTDEYQREIEFVKRDLIEFFDKAANVTIMVDNSAHNNRFRLMFELDERWIKDRFQWGNDQKFIKYFGDYIGERAQQEIFRINVRR